MFTVLLRMQGNRARLRVGEGMQMKAAFNVVVRPLSTLSFAMSTMGMLERV
jgi:hypothetical protein